MLRFVGMCGTATSTFGRLYFLFEVVCEAGVGRPVKDDDANVGENWGRLGIVETEDSVNNALSHKLLADTKYSTADSGDDDGSPVVCFASLECVTNDLL